MTTPDFSFLRKNKKPIDPIPVKDPNVPDFSFLKPEEHTQSFIDYMKNVSKNWMSEGASRSAVNAMKLLDPLSASKMLLDPSVKMAAGDLLHTFDHILDYGNPVQAATNIGIQLGSSEGGLSGTGLAIGAVKPLVDIMELSSNLQLTEDDTRALKPEEKAERIKNTAGLIAASAVAGPLSIALGGAPVGGLGQRLLFGAKVGAGSGAAYGAVSSANERDQLSQIISGAIMGGTLGSAHGILKPKLPELIGQTSPNYSHPDIQRGLKAQLDMKPEEAAQYRQLQLENNSPVSTIKLAQALATNDDIAAALIEGKLGLQKGDIHIVPGIDVSKLALVEGKIPEGYKSVMHIDKDGIGNLLVHDESVSIDTKFYEKTGLIKDQSVSYNGQDHWAVKDASGDNVKLQNLNDPGSIIDAHRNDVRMLSNVILDRAKATDTMYEEWKSSMRESSPLKPAEPGEIDNSTGSILDQVPDINSINLQKNLNKFLAAKGFQGNDLTSLKRELQIKLAKESGATLEPEEIANIETAKQIKYGSEKEKIKSWKELTRIAKSNGFDVTDGGSGRIVVREIDKNGVGKIIKGFDNQEQAIKWMNKSGQKTGINLDGNGFLDTEIAGGGIPPIPPESETTYINDDQYNYLGNKANRFENLITGLNNVAWATRNRDFFLKIDTEHGTKLAVAFDNIMQKKNIMRARWQPYAEEIALLMKSLKKLTPAQLERIGYHMETMSPKEIIERGMARPMTPFEIAKATELSKNGVDIDRIFKYRREGIGPLEKEFPLEKRQADPNVEQEYQTRLHEAKQAYAIDDVHQKYSDLFDVIETMRKDDAAIGPIVRLARAISNNNLTQSEFATQQKMTFEELRASNQLADMYKRLAKVFGINEKNTLQNFMTHARLYGDDIGRATLDFSGDGKTKDFYAKLSRTGELSAIERDAIKAMVRYQKAGFDVQSGFADAVKEGKSTLRDELNKIADSGTREKVKEVFARYLDDVQGFPGTNDKAAQEVVNRITTKLGFKDINVSAWTNAATSLMAAGGLGARPMLGIGHLGISTLLGVSARSHSYMARVLKAGGVALTDHSVLQDLQDRGVMAGLSPIAALSGAEYAGTPRGVFRAGQDALFKTSLLPTVYDGMAAGHFLVTEADALNSLTKFGRKEITWAEVKKNTFLDRYDAPVVDHFTELVKSGKPNVAAEYLGRQAIDDLVGVYGAGNSPYGWGSNLGKVMGQFGNFAMFVRANVTRTMSRGTVGQRIGGVAKLAAYTAILNELSDETGIQLNRMSPVHAMFWMFGPAVGMAQDATMAVKGTGYAQSSAIRRLRKMIPIDKDGNFQPSLFLPGSFAIDGLIHAADDISNGELGIGIAEAAGFHRTTGQAKPQM